MHESGIKGFQRDRPEREKACRVRSIGARGNKKTAGLVNEVCACGKALETIPEACARL